MRSLWTLFTLQDTGYIDQFWNGSLIAPVSFSGWDIHTVWPRGHLAQWGQSTSTRVREKVYIYSIFHVNSRFLPLIISEMPFFLKLSIIEIFSANLLISLAVIFLHGSSSQSQYWQFRGKMNTTCLLSVCIFILYENHWDWIFYRADWGHLNF
mgnify:FL=1